MEVKEIALSKIFPNPKQPRKRFNKSTIKELAESINLHGLQNPIQISPLKKIGNYEIISGERRFRAYKSLNKDTIPAIIQKVSLDKKMILSLIENVQRENLNSMEAAEGYKALIDTMGCSYSELAKQIGKGKKFIVDHLSLLKLPVKLKDEIRDGFSYSTMLEISKIKDTNLKNEALEKAKTEGISLKKIREFQKNHQESVRIRTDEVLKPFKYKAKAVIPANFARPSLSASKENRFGLEAAGAVSVLHKDTTSSDKIISATHNGTRENGTNGNYEALNINNKTDNDRGYTFKFFKWKIKIEKIE